jgi:hypothetical protein
MGLFVLSKGVERAGVSGCCNIWVLEQAIPWYVLLPSSTQYLGSLCSSVHLVPCRIIMISLPCTSCYERAYLRNNTGNVSTWYLPCESTKLTAGTVVSGQPTPHKTVSDPLLPGDSDPPYRRYTGLTRATVRDTLTTATRHCRLSNWGHPGDRRSLHVRYGPAAAVARKSLDGVIRMVL